MEKIRAITVDDHQVTREGLRWMLSGDGSVEIVGEAESAEGAETAIVEHSPDVVLLDIHFPGKSGLEALRDIRSRFPSLPVVMLTMSDDPEYVQQAIASGAAAYLLKNASREEMLRAVQAAARGSAYIQAEVTRPLLARLAAAVSEDAGVPHLAPREREVVSLLSQGMANKQIATELGVAEPTVKFHLRNVYEKLGAADRAEAVAIALRRHIID